MPVPQFTYREALRARHRPRKSNRDPNVVLMGEEVAQFNGAYKISEGMLAKYGPQAHRRHPDLRGRLHRYGRRRRHARPAPRHGADVLVSFYSVAFDQIFNNAANIRYMSGGLINCPIVLRGPANGGTNVGATHSHTPENVHRGLPPRHQGRCPLQRPTTRRACMKSAIRDNDPVMFMENTHPLRRVDARCRTANIIVPLGKANILREGKDISIIVTYGRCDPNALAQAAASISSRRSTTSPPRSSTCAPSARSTIETILNSVKPRRSRALLIVEESEALLLSVGAHGGRHHLSDKAFDYLDGSGQAPQLDRRARPSTRCRSRPSSSRIPNVDRIYQAALAAVA